MTEADWNTSTDPQAMLQFLRASGKASDRKLRLFAVACCRRVWHLLVDERSRAAVEVAERFADGLATCEELCDPWPRHLPEPVASNPAGRSSAKAEASARDAARLAAARDTRSMGVEFFTPDAARYAASAVAWSTIGYAKSAAHAESWAVAWDRAASEEYAEQARLLRDIFGNPFAAPPCIDLSCVTPPVLSLAQRAYDERQLPEGLLDAALLSALADAGCSDAGLLAHLRGPGPHVRGCFALDAVLGRS